MSTFNGMDYAVFVLLFLSVAVGTARGLVKEVVSLLAWVAAFIIATVYSVRLAALLSGPSAHLPGIKPIESVPLIAVVISYLALFIGSLICGSLIKLIVNYFVESSGLGLINRLLGAVFGLARGCVIVLLALFFLAFTALTAQALWKDSKLVPVFYPGVKWLNKVAEPYLSEIKATMKKTTKNLDEEDLSDVIKVKPADITIEQSPSVTVEPSVTEEEIPASTP